MTLAYQSLGVVYGDLSISPLYVYKSTFAEDIHHSESNEEIFGVLSFIFWTITLVPLLKYVFIVLRADDNGEGGTFALYSLLCRHARVNSLPSCQLADEQLIEYKTDSIGSSTTPQSAFAASLKTTLEKHGVLQKILLVLALIGTCMVIGDGVLTPAISGKSIKIDSLTCSLFYVNDKNIILFYLPLFICFCQLQFFLQYQVLSFQCLRSITSVSFFPLFLISFIGCLNL